MRAQAQTFVDKRRRTVSAAGLHARQGKEQQTQTVDSGVGPSERADAFLSNQYRCMWSRLLSTFLYKTLINKGIQPQTALSTLVCA